MNLQSDAAGASGMRTGFPGPTELASEEIVSPLEFRSMECLLPGDGLWPHGLRDGGTQGFDGFTAGTAERELAREMAVLEAAKTARAEGIALGEREGIRRTRAEMEAEMHAAGERAREQLRLAVEQFGASRERYFAEIEPEVVKLALAIAARVLHREVQIDPLLLAGAVRVALEKMETSGGVTLRAAEEDVAGWQEMFEATKPAQRPKIAGDATLVRGECVLETAMGTVDLGVSAQLEEIEKGFFDLLQHRPAR